MKIHGRLNYKAGPRDEAGTPPYAITPLLHHIGSYCEQLGIPRRKFIILEPATGLLSSKRHNGIVDGFQYLGYQVLPLHGEDFISADFDELQDRSERALGCKIRMIVTNPPFSVALKRRFIEKCESIFEHSGIPYALLMQATTFVEKVNGKTLRGCSIHVPYGRINYDMPNKGWGSAEEPTKATFETVWYSKGIAGSRQIFYNDFDMSNHFEALNNFNNIFTDERS